MPDDYHQIDSKVVHEAVSFLVENLPDRVCLVITTRLEPPQPLHRLRVRGQLVEPVQQNWPCTSTAC